MKTLSSFKNPVFRRYYAGLLAQRSAMNMRMITRLLLIYALTDSYSILGLMAVANALPMMLSSLFGGAIADRMQKKHIMLVGQASSAVISLIIAVTLTTGYLNANTWWILLVTAIFTGIFGGIMMPSRQAIVPEIVGDDHLLNAVALNNLAMNLLRLFAPAVAGFLIDAYDFHVVYYLMTAMSVIAIVFIATLPLTGKIITSGNTMLTDIRKGFQYVWRNKTVLFTLLFVLVVILLSRPYQQLMPIFVDDEHLNIGASGMGILMGISGAGAIAGSIILASLPDKKRGLMLIAGCIALGMALIGFSFSSSLYVAYGLMVVLGLLGTVRMTLGNTLVQYYTEEEYRGRVMSIYTMDFGLTSIGTFGASILAGVIGLNWSIGGFAMVLILFSVLVMALVPRIRQLD
jgi:MFS family permease